ncbi:MAG: MutT related protein [Parcubacteria group bacterium GW2011_GWA2_47_8]|nr:MAG: MutT related protein [Parcubacteria group bacterium GW2011_GWA2_47_8]OHB19038.1 MAG: hypothetical protein A2666_04365 [Parcubacteria group bacterium RIFCSPHIGHO2_01_FULL_47_10b]
MQIIQKAAIKKDNTFLILLRSPEAKYFPEHWDFPGGKLGANEDQITGIQREVFEETGLKLRDLKVAGVYELDLDKARHITHRFTVYKGSAVNGAVRISSEHSAFRWATKEAILRLPIEPYIRLFFVEQLPL